MIELYLVRHGQADSKGRDYDKLTPVGFEQAKKLGKWMHQSGLQFDRLIHGGLRRQKETLTTIQQQLNEENREVEENPGLAEFDMRVWKLIAEKLRHEKGEFLELLKNWNLFVPKTRSVQGWKS